VELSDVGWEFMQYEFHNVLELVKMGHPHSDLKVRRSQMLHAFLGPVKAEKCN
jgi:hypothetical protein